MQVETSPASLQDKAILANLLQLYLYDINSIEHGDLNDLGRYEYRYFDAYWSDPERWPFLIRADGRLAGFALVRRLEDGAMSVAEFFVLPKYRRHGVGDAAARQMFDRFPGRWEVRELAKNAGAQRFWRAVLRAYTGGRFSDISLADETWDGPVQTFETAPNG